MTGRSRAVKLAVSASVLAVLAVVVLTARANSTNQDGGGAGTSSSVSERQILDKIVSVFENGVTDLQYDYIEDLGDGRGYTAGRAGFCSACGDMCDIVRRYTDRVPSNALARYLPTLSALAREGSDNLTLLDGLPSAWQSAAIDPVFRQVQDSVVDDTYYQPAMGLAARQGLSTAVSRLIMYDTAVQHGVTGADSLTAITEQVTAQLGGSPGTGIDETVARRVPRAAPFRPRAAQHARDPGGVVCLGGSRGRPRQPARPGQYGTPDPASDQSMGLDG
ncbi:hypothetical protein GCM10010472_47550 [Pseudonocardia halophobica]|uniref:Chitosanase n=1 Tax=Pseudonocardia halophobica TaxID=29401 RepID=A0A9W6NXK6_9PSEU|nr:hypothetical protein GCM10017577_47140 [Pseudonocardia halophobica]